MPTYTTVLDPAHLLHILSASSYHVLFISLFTSRRPLLVMMKSPVELTVYCRDRERKEDMDLPGPFSACVLPVTVIYTAPPGVNTHPIMWFVNVVQHQRSPSANRQKNQTERVSGVWEVWREIDMTVMPRHLSPLPAVRSAAQLLMLPPDLFSHQSIASWEQRLDFHVCIKWSVPVFSRAFTKQPGSVQHVKHFSLALCLGC